MTDSGQTPKRAFEPPPWEKEQFEELARKRADEQRADAALDELMAPAPVPEPEPEPEEAFAIPAPGGTAPAGEAMPGGPPVPEQGQAASPALDEKRVAAMLLQLSGEEKPVMHQVKRASRVVSVVVMALGTVVLLIAALVAMRSGGQSQLGAMSGLVGATIGAGIVGVGAWLWIRAKK